MCLGHQCIGQAFGGRIVRAKQLMHGKTSRIHHDGRGVFAGLEQGFVATRYHSLVIERATIPAVPRDQRLDATTARSWACATRALAVEGVQFHPESILTVSGKELLANFLSSL